MRTGFAKSSDYDSDYWNIGGQLCQAFVEFDERFYVARYTLFGTTAYLLRCLKLIG